MLLFGLLLVPWRGGVGGEGRGPDGAHGNGGGQGRGGGDEEEQGLLLSADIYARYCVVLSNLIFINKQRMKSFLGMCNMFTDLRIFLQR